MAVFNNTVGYAVFIAMVKSAVWALAHRVVEVSATGGNDDCIAEDRIWVDSDTD